MRSTGPRPPAARPLRQAQMLVDRERGPDAPALRHVADAEIGDPVGRQAQYVLAAETDDARGRHESGDGVAQRRLAHAVAADHGQHAAIERQRHALQHVGAAEMNVEIVDLEDRPRAGPRRTSPEQVKRMASPRACRRP